jgi:aldose 1-epimerase
MTDASLVTLTSSTARVVLSPAVGGRISSFVVDGMELLGGMDDSDIGWGCFPMVPWQGRLTENAIAWKDVRLPMPVNYAAWSLHGLVFTEAWSVDEVDATSAELSIQLGTEPGSPWRWPCDVRARYELSDDRLVSSLTIESRGDEFPAELGWHPWYRRRLTKGGPLEFDLGPGRMFLRGAGDILTGDLVDPPGGPYDDAFELTTGRYSLTWPGALTLDCETDCRYAVAFDHMPDVVCVEPQTAPPDWINRQPGLVRPGSPRTARAVWSWSVSP